MKDLSDLGRRSQDRSCKGVETYGRAYTLFEGSDDMPKTCLALLKINFFDDLQD